ncbi:Uncharacterised protein [Streptobacillus moniliformis]|nr:Uncharacterised protein [Streptobacillus moniliformis]
MYNSNKIKSIFSKYILTNSINSIKPYFDKKHIEHINHSIHNFLNCGNLSKGFISYRCSSCNFQHKMKLTCKSRLCPSCGYNYSVNWTNSILKQFINIPHSMSFLLSLKNLENLLLMIDLFFLKCLKLLMIFLNINSIISR